MKRLLIMTLCAMSVLSGCGKAKQPNVVVIVLDTLRGDRLSCAGYKRPTTPHIDALAAQGALYTHAYSTCFWTLPAHASLFTGLHPLQAGATSETLHLPYENKTLAEVLNDAGYHTGAFVCNSFVSDERGFAQGFQDFVEMWRRQNQKGADSTMSSMEELTVKKMASWMEAAARETRPFFLFANLNGVHLPYDPIQKYWSQFVTDPGYDSTRVHALSTMTSGWAHVAGELPLSETDYRILNDLYDAEVAWADDLVGRVVDVLTRLKIADNTVIVVLSDHGESLGEHDRVDHIASMYDPALHIPLVIRFPHAFKPGTRVDDLVSIVDVAPTILDVCGAAELAPGMHAETASLARKNRAKEEFVLAGNERPLTGIELLKSRFPGYDYNLIDYRLRCLRTPSHKLIANEGHGAELYNLAKDPGETNNLAQSQADTQREMMGLLTSSFEKMGKSKEYFMLESKDREALEKLRSLGYIN